MRNILSLACDTDQVQPALSREQFTRAAAKARLQYWTEVLERAARLLGSGGVLSGCPEGKGQLSLPGADDCGAHGVLEVLDGLPTEKVTGKQSVQRGGAPDHPAVIAAGWAPQAARVLGDPTPQQVAAPFACQARGIPVAGVAPHEAMGTAGGTQPCLAGPSAGLPAGGGGQRLALGQETAHFFFTGKLGQDGSVSQNAHVQGLLRLGGFLLGAVPDHGIALRQVQVECDEGPVLQAQCPQGGAIDLGREVAENEPAACSS